MADGNVTAESSKVGKLLDMVDAMRSLKRGTREDIAVRAQLHPNTVGRYMVQMHKRGWIKPSGFVVTGSRGGPAVLWEWLL